MLSVRKIEHAPPGRHADGNGLYLLVKPSGSRSWILRVQHNGRRRDFGLGSAITGIIDVDLPVQKRSSLTLAQAREKARIARELAKAGINPRAYWREREEKVPSFEQVAREYHAQVAKGWRNGKHNSQWLATLEAYAFPVIGSKLVDEIDARDIQRVVGPIWLTKGETARRTRQRIGAVLNYAHGRGWRGTEAPMKAVQQLLAGIKQPRGKSFAALPYRDVPELFAKLRCGERSVGRLALRFLILTAARSGEVRKARWRDVDAEAGEWRIPPANAKIERQHIVPLGRAGLQILDELRAFSEIDSDDLIFPGLKGMMSDATMAKALRSAGGCAATVHGFRSSFRDWAAESGFSDSWAEAALAHINPNRIESAYRRTTFFDQRRDSLMPAWAAFVTSISNDQSVELPRA